MGAKKNARGNKMNEELKPCPRCCNVEIILIYRHKKFSLECYECKYRIKFTEYQDEAIKDWNKRA